MHLPVCITENTTQPEIHLCFRTFQRVNFTEVERKQTPRQPFCRCFYFMNASPNDCFPFVDVFCFVFIITSRNSYYFNFHVRCCVFEKLHCTVNLFTEDSKFITVFSLVFFLVCLSSSDWKLSSTGFDQHKNI